MKRIFTLTLFFIFSLLFISTTNLYASKRALLVGISDYLKLPSEKSSSKHNLKDLRGAPNDIRLMKQIFQKYGFSKKDIKVLFNSQATMQNISYEFRKWLIKGTKPGDLVVFYFTGHGSQIPDQNGDETDGKDEVLLPYNADPETGYNIIVDDLLGSWLRQLKGREVVAIIDSCYSGGAIRGIRGNPVSELYQTPAWLPKYVPLNLRKGYIPPQPEQPLIAKPDIPEDVVFFGASRENQVAYEIKEPNGLFYGGFTLALATVLAHEKNPTYQDVYKQVTEKVWDELNLPQKPVLIASKDILRTTFLKSAPSSAQNISLPQRDYHHVLVALSVQGISDKETELLKKQLSDLPFVKIVSKDSFFDRLITGKKDSGVFHIKLLNRIGDAEKIEPASNIQELVTRIKKHLEYAYIVMQLAKLHNPNPSFKVQAWVSDKNRRDFYLGEEVKFGVRSEKDAYILLVNIDSKGNFHIIFPNKYHQKNFIRANTTLMIPDKTMRQKEFKLVFGPPEGEEIVKVIATDQPLDLKELGITGFNQTFISLKGKARAIFVQRVEQNLTSGKISWSDDTVIIRSHKK